jgi:metabotropic X receptor
MCYGMTFILVQKPSDFLCGAQKAGIGFCFAVVYSAILTKTNRIARIFKAGKKSARRPSFISPKSQLLICGGLAIIQVFITVVWLAFSPPKAIHFYPTREDNHLVCEASIKAGNFVAFIYPIFLIGKNQHFSFHLILFNEKVLILTHYTLYLLNINNSVFS